MKMLNRLYHLTIIWIPLLMLSTHNVLGADPCAESDLNALPESPLRQLPAYDQGNSDVCYAFASSILINYHKMRTLKSSKVTPPMLVAVQRSLNSKETKTTLAGGDFEDTIQSLKREGACDPDTFEVAMKTLESLYPDSSTHEVLSWLSRQLELRDSILSDPKCLHQSCKSACIGTPETLSLEQYLSAQGLENELSQKIFQNIFAACSKRKDPLMSRIPDAKTHTNLPPSEYTKILSEQLHKLKKPVGLSTISRSLDNTASNCVSYNPKSKSTELHPKAKGCGFANSKKLIENAHAVVIVGQKKIDGKCQVMIRNSWGGDWQPPARTGQKPLCSCEMVDATSETVTYHSVCPEAPNSSAQDSDELDLSVPFVRRYLGCWYERSHILSNTAGLTTL